MITKQQYHNSGMVYDRFRIASIAGLPKRYFVDFALDCARMALPFVIMDDIPTCRTLINTVEMFLQGKATSEDCRRIHDSFNGHDFSDTVDVVCSCAAAVYTNTVEAATYSAIGIEKVFEDHRHYEYDYSVFDIVKQHLTWNHVLASYIARAIHHMFQPPRIAAFPEGEMNFIIGKPPTPDQAFELERSLVSVVDFVLTMPIVKRDHLFQYAEVILESDGLQDHFDYLINDYVSETNCFTTTTTDANLQQKGEIDLNGN